MELEEELKDISPYLEMEVTEDFVILRYKKNVVARFSAAGVEPRYILDEARKYLKEVNDMTKLKERLKRISPKFSIKEEPKGFSLWYGRDHRILLWEQGELSDEEIIRLARDFLNRNPWLKRR